MASIKLHKALLAARMDAKEIVKADRADVGAYKYDFTSGEDMIAFCREKLHEHGLTFELVGTQVMERPSTDWPVMFCIFKVTHVETGDQEERHYDMPFPPQKDLDKKAGGAMTYMLGHAHRCLLDLPKVSKSDAQHDPDRRNEEVKAAPRATPRGVSQKQALYNEVVKLTKDYEENVGKVGIDQVIVLALGEKPKAKLTAKQWAEVRDWLQAKLVEEEQGPDWMDVDPTGQDMGPAGQEAPA